MQERFSMFYAARAAVQIIYRISSIILCFLALAPACARAADKAPPTRVALVIGNSRYEAAVGPLRNTVNDAKVVARTLRTLGFSVIEEHNLTRDALLAAMLKFRSRLRGTEVGLFYFAGHGISVAGANYLLPIKSGYNPEESSGTSDQTSRRLLAETKLFNAEQAVAEMSNLGTGCNLVILDACRVTPVARNPANRDAASNGGLVEMNPPAGSLIAFSTDAGRVALDGEGTNGLYTAELIRHLRTPGLSIEQVFKRTRAGVIAKSGGTQIPAEYSRLVGDDIYLAGREVNGEPTIPKGRPIPLPSSAEIAKLAAKGDTEACIQAIRQHTRAGSSLNAAASLGMLLEHAKESLRDPESATPRAEAILQTCDLLLGAVDDCLGPAHSQRHALLAKAHNRRGDALLLLGKPNEALEAFNAALALTPTDAYVLYNRGVALLKLDRNDEARSEFQKIADTKGTQPGARKLAIEALAKLK